MIATWAHKHLRGIPLMERVIILTIKSNVNAYFGR